MERAVNICFVLSVILLKCTHGYKEMPGLSGKMFPKTATFHFPEYAYKETSKNEITYHEQEVACEQHTQCVNLNVGVTKINCIRHCISPSCYQDIYAFNALEEGEIDVRLNSFKGCVIQRM
ncbi:GL11860 [Drosophila persimilis]|uniref:Uncharacterized protein n=2 Tax=pseudoobscura subgroup TaxID=32358 RepID=A0A6I8V6C4_DROPS|nr:uncharacterized protein LOC6601563 [Drosophila persimilis]XP_002139037.1 uncharacterized protein LOC6899120 [Drosophila pseudoobscura]XP_033233744.1 uncharacterized protein LOC6899120 [Drosophila pseudoobscura]EDW33652.1 GL11860 [Drosophila persimilis]